MEIVEIESLIPSFPPFPSRHAKAVRKNSGVDAVGCGSAIGAFVSADFSKISHITKNIDRWVLLFDGLEMASTETSNFALCDTGLASINDAP